MVFGLKKKKEEKNQTVEFVNGKQTKQHGQGVPLPPEEPAEAPLEAQAVFDEGKSVGFQEGMILCMNLINDHLTTYQDDLRAKIAEAEAKLK